VGFLGGGKRKEDLERGDRKKLHKNLQTNNEIEMVDEMRKLG